MKDDTALPDAVEKLLALLGGDAFEDETSLFYAFLLCDGLNWKLIGCFNAGFLPVSLSLLITTICFIISIIMCLIGLLAARSG